ncbi:MAG: 4-hydroxy-3-methylbut-2-enyl diphosphate reductase, partial [Gammaproteobacteria bacterium]
ATCPLVTKVHSEVGRHARGGEDVILIGHAGHPEVEGTLGRYPESGDGRIALVESVEDVHTLEVRDPGNLAYVTQTTLSMDDTADIIAALRSRFPEIRGPRKDDICYATQNRQDAVKGLTENADLVLVVGSKNSSNSNRLREIAERSGRDAYLVDGPQDIDPAWLEGHSIIGVTAGASAPELLVTAVTEKLKTLGVNVVDEADGKRETVTFPLPRELRG